MGRVISKFLRDARLRRVPCEKGLDGRSFTRSPDTCVDDYWIGKGSFGRRDRFPWEMTREESVVPRWRKEWGTRNEKKR